MAITRRSALAAIGGLAAAPALGATAGAQMAWSQAGGYLPGGGQAGTGRLLPELGFLDEIVPAVLPL